LDLTVVIPSFGFTALLRLCLVQLERSLAALAGGSRAIVVVDNASPFPYQPS
jgi:hypothetical protein